jgi:hypothetical protein
LLHNLVDREEGPDEEAADDLLAQALPEPKVQQQEDVAPQAVVDPPYRRMKKKWKRM